MTDTPTAFVGADIFDGTSLLTGRALLIAQGAVVGIVPDERVPETFTIALLPGGTLLPGFVDLQVNGGGGVMFNDAQDVNTLRVMAQAHGRLGTAAILPTLITDTPERTRAAIAATEAARAAGVAGIAGLHLEGPHLSVARKGAHDPALIRPMTAEDLNLLCGAAGRLPALMLTVAPETVTPEQIAALTAAGARVSLGHSDADYETCVAAVAAGACCVTHLFNAQSQLGNREPGVVGAALSLGALSAGLIADLVHVHPASLTVALAAKAGPGRIFLVTDAMAPAGTDMERFTLNGREITRRNQRLTLADGTLAGADLDLATAIGNLTRVVGTPAAEAMAMATSIPADLMGLGATHGRLETGRTADVVYLDAAGHLSGVWQRGALL